MNTNVFLCSQNFNMPARLTIEDMIQTAQLRGGRCLSKEYIGARSLLKWMCKRGHTWDSSSEYVKMGYWCIQCIKEDEKEERFEEIKHAAKAKGGKCLSARYEHSQQLLNLQCKNGHRWEASYHSIVILGRWCRKCFAITRRTSIDVLRKVAQNYGGKLLSKKYERGDVALKWKCREGHVWMATPSNVKNNFTWCPKCAYKNNGEMFKLDISAYQEVARKHNGKLLSKKYTNAFVKMKWQCTHGHIWLAKPYAVRDLGSWCPVCARQRGKYSIHSRILKS